MMSFKKIFIILGIFQNVACIIPLLIFLLVPNGNTFTNPIFNTKNAIMPDLTFYVGYTISRIIDTNATLFMFWFYFDFLFKLAFCKQCKGDNIIEKYLKKKNNR